MAAAGRAWGRSAWPHISRRICRGIRWPRSAADKGVPPVSAAPWGSASILLISYGYIRMLGAAGCHRRDEVRDPQRQLHQVAAREALRRALHAAERPRRARDDFRPAEVQGERRRGRRRRQAPDGLRLPRADGVVPGAGDADGRADGKRAEGRARSFLRGAHRDSPGDRGSRHREGRCEGQRAEERAAHGRGGERRRVDASLFAREGGVPAAVGQGQQVLAVGRPHRQSRMAIAT